MPMLLLALLGVSVGTVIFAHAATDHKKAKTSHQSDKDDLQADDKDDGDADDKDDGNLQVGDQKDNDKDDGDLQVGDQQDKNKDDGSVQAGTQDQKDVQGGPNDDVKAGDQIEQNVDMNVGEVLDTAMGLVEQAISS
jgi:hypothetical protein